MPQVTNENWLTSIDQATLTPLVRQALRSDTVEILDWEYHPLIGGVGDSGQGLQGLYRFSGAGRDQGEAVNWSLILKYSWTQEQGGDPEGGQRERLAYQSGVLKNLPGIAAPRCFGVEELSGGLWLMWLEEVTDLFGKWPLERYRLAARHLGQFNGAWLTPKSPPDWPWMSRNWLREFVARAAPAIAQFPGALKDPLVRRGYPPDVEAALLRLWDERELFLDALDRLPQTVCHMDAFRRNLFARQPVNGQEQTVAIDWAFTGIGALGEEIAPMILGSVGFNEVELADLEALEEIVLDGYLDGLRDAGWRGDPRAVRFGYAAAAPLRYGIGVMSLILADIANTSQRADQEQTFRLSIEARRDLYATVIRHSLKRLDEARNLLDGLP